MEWLKGAQRGNIGINIGTTLSLKPECHEAFRTQFR
jgi:hypothetical protein